MSTALHPDVPIVSAGVSGLTATAFPADQQIPSITTRKYPRTRGFGADSLMAYGVGHEFAGCVVRPKRQVAWRKVDMTAPLVTEVRTALQRILRPAAPKAVLP
jgi:hypothetical protein